MGDDEAADPAEGAACTGLAFAKDAWVCLKGMSFKIIGSLSGINVGANGNNAILLDAGTELLLLYLDSHLEMTIYWKHIPPGPW